MNEEVFELSNIKQTNKKELRLMILI
jgi:hypothetical protein